MEQEELDVAGGYVTRYVVVEELVDVFEIPVKYPGGKSSMLQAILNETRKKRPPPLVGVGGGDNIHMCCAPLHFFYNVQTAVQDELVHMPRRLVETRHAVAALLRGAKLMLEQRVVLGADDGEVVRHFL